jgi:HSP20 family molecular chaperone IbpA
LDSWFDRPLWEREVGASKRAGEPPVDVYSDDDGLVLRVEVPGVPPENLKIETQDRNLVIKSEGAGEHGAARPFARAFRVPADHDLKRVEARHELGVLTVRIPKAEEAKPRKVEVKIQ